MFKFNFQLKPDDCDDNTLPNVAEEEDNSEVTESSLVWKSNLKHTIGLEHFSLVTGYDFNKVEEINWKDNINLRFIRSEELNQTVKDVPQQAQCHSDLIPAVYEGGFKIWECTYDLLKYIKDNQIPFKNKSVFELGCGTGLLGIVAAIEGASRVTFQDYNEEVLNVVTIPNVILNLPNILPEVNLNASSEKRLEKYCNAKFKFYSGDWGGLPQRVFSEGERIDESELVGVEDGNKFDFVLTSETIYNPHNHAKLIKVFDKCLKPHGKVLLASKNYYFGVGGGTHDFIRLISSSERKFDVSTTVCHNEGVQREILTIKKIKMNNSFLFFYNLKQCYQLQFFTLL